MLNEYSMPWVLFAFDNVYSGHHNHPHDHHTLRRKRRRVVGRSSRITRPPRGGSALRCSFLESETPRAINHTCSQGSRNHRNPETTQLYHFPVKGRAGGHVKLPKCTDVLLIALFLSRGLNSFNSRLGI